MDRHLLGLTENRPPDRQRGWGLRWVRGGAPTPQCRRDRGGGGESAELGVGPLGVGSLGQGRPDGQQGQHPTGHEQDGADDHGPIEPGVEHRRSRRRRRR